MTDTQVMAALEPCPFCGSDAHWCPTYVDADEPGTVTCAGGCGATVICSGSKAVRIAAWNRRSTPLPPPAVDDRFRVMLLDLLAVIHGDGGHKTQEIGVNAAHAQAMQLSAERKHRPAVDAEVRKALEKCRDQFQFYATEHKAKSDAAYKAWDDARYWGNVDEQDKARKELEKRRKQAATNEEMVVMCDAALSTSPAGQEVRDIVSWLRDQSEKGAEIGITKEKETFSRGVYAGGSLALKRAADMIESGKYRSDLTTPSVEPAGNVGLDLGAISSGHCYCWCHKSAGTIGCSPCCENEDNYLPPSKRDPALSSVEPAGNGREAVENAFIAGWEAQKAGRSFAAAMNDHIPALSSPPAADQEAVKCKRCNDTGWTIGNGTVREGCLSCDAQINMVRATPPAPASSGEGDELRHKLWMVISHASGGHLSKEDDSDRSINDICVEISRHHNRIWEQALEKGRQEATTSTERGR